MVKIDLYTCVGFALELLSKSEYHRQHSLGDYFRTEILPAYGFGQFRFYVNDQGIPTGLVTWAWLSDEVQAEIHKTGRALQRSEWRSGENLFFNDFVTPYGTMKPVLRDFTKNVFPMEIATSLRRNADGSVRRINRWIGANYLQSERGKVA